MSQNKALSMIGLATKAGKVASGEFCTEKEVKSVKEAIDGAKDIIAESVSDEADYRSWIRKITMKKGKLISTAKDPEAESVYEMYYEFEEPLSKLAGHARVIDNLGRITVDFN